MVRNTTSDIEITKSVSVSQSANIIGRDRFLDLISDVPIGKLNIIDHELNSSDRNKISTDIGNIVRCKSKNSDLILIRYKNVSRPIHITYDPIVTIGRKCVFTKSDDRVRIALNMLIDDSIDKKIIYVYYDTKSIDSVNHRFNDRRLDDIIYYVSPDSAVSEVVLIFKANPISIALDNLHTIYNSSGSKSMIKTLQKHHKNKLTTTINMATDKKYIVIIIGSVFILFFLTCFLDDIIAH